MRTIAVLNQKGGVGKTTTVANVAGALAAAGQRVIVIDLDPQAHLTIHLGVEPQTIAGGVYDVLTQSADFHAGLMLVRPNLWLLAANINLVGAETELVNVVGREIILREAMQASQDQFDFCLIDCPPSLSVLSLNALAAAQEVLIPLQPHFLALQGFGKLLQTIDLVNKRINPRLKVTGVLFCMHDTRASLSNEVRADIDRFLQAARGAKNAWSGAQILPTFIRRNIKLAEAPSYGQTVFEYDPTCNGAEDYGKVAKYLLGIEETPAPQPAEPGAREQAVDATDIPPVATPTPAPADAPAEAPTTDTVCEAQENDPGPTSPANASEELPSDSPAESPWAAEPLPAPDDDVVEAPLTGPPEVPTMDPAPEAQEDNPREISLADTSGESPPADGPAEPSGAPEPPAAPYENRMETPPAAPERNESPASAAPVDAPPAPQADRPAQSTPAAGPIPIVTVNPLVPQCYNPVPIWPEPATSSSPTPNRQAALRGKRRRHSTRPILLLSSWIVGSVRWILSYSNPLRVIRPSAAPLLSPAED